MSWIRNALIGRATLASLIGVLSAVPAGAQGDPEHPRFRAGPLGFSPIIQLTNMGRDSNVFDLAEDSHPTSDVTATLTPSLEAWWRTPHVQMSAHGRVDYFYFKELTNLRSLDTEGGARLEVRVNRVTPWVDGNLVDGSHHQTFEIDAYTKMRDESVRGGAEVRLTPKTSFGIYAARSHVGYEDNSRFLGTDLARALNRTGTTQGAGMQYAVTPLTTVSIYAERQQDRFEFAANRDSDSVRVMPTIEFKPLALISGRASVGFRTVRFLQGDVPGFRGTVASVDLQYTFRGQTRFGITVRRDLDYSFLDEQRVYLSSGFSTWVAHRLGGGWDLRGTVGRTRLNYDQLVQVAGVTNEAPGEVSISVSGDVGYQLGRSRVGFSVSRGQRDSDLAVGRGYKRVRIGSSITYQF
jgi:hypothetical protein